jgi:type IV fimbrial biogenesis protein FimT
MNKINKTSGFTIMELMIVIAIAGILVAVGIPSFRNLVKDNCLTTGTNLLVSSFQQARSEAVKRSTTLTITASNAGVSTNEWGNGWTVTINEDSNNNSVLDTGEDFDGDGLLGDGTTYPEATFRIVTLSCTGTTMDETGNDTVFVYESDGFIDDPGTFDVCDDRTGETGKQITLNAVGRPNTETRYGGCS